MELGLCVIDILRLGLLLLEGLGAILENIHEFLQFFTRVLLHFPWVARQLNSLDTHHGTVTFFM